MIRWIWARFVKWGWDYSYEAVDTKRSMRGSKPILVDDYESGIDLDDPIKFSVQAVQGGTLIETRWYDHQKDNNIKKMHIVTPDQDLAEAIGKIVSMELLRR